MTPSTVNAYYEPSMNHIVLPAGIMQGFIFNEYHHPLVNYATIGAIAGHEMTHGFDDQGAQYDGTGKFTNWWSPSVLTAWKERTTCLSNFYSKYEALPGLNVNGDLTLGENIADLGGLKQSYNAYQNYMKTNPGKKMNEILC
jgi:putative endopeptidase